MGQPLVLVGYGQPGHGATGQVSGGDARPTKRAGPNRYDAIRGDYSEVDFLAYDFDNGLLENNSLALFGVESDLGFGADEVFQAPGDSGGPSFIGSAIAAVTAFYVSGQRGDVTNDLDSSWGEVGFNTRVSDFRSFILAATGGEARFVPEPTGVLILAWGLILSIATTLCRRRCQSATTCRAKDLYG